MFAALGLSDHRTHFRGELSVGLARRTALARAFAVRPTLLLLDEPFVSLDAPLARQLQRDLARLVESRGMRRLLSPIELCSPCAPRMWWEKYGLRPPARR